VYISSNSSGARGTVTTRATSYGSPGAELIAAGLWICALADGCALRPRVRAAVQPVPVGVAGVWRLASGAPSIDNPELGSSAGWLVGGETGAGNPCASRHATEVFSCAPCAPPGLQRSRVAALFPRE
jgi:hypothetical protein